MVAHYQQNYPREPYDDVDSPPVRAPGLAIHGLDDPSRLAAGWNGTGERLAAELGR